MTHLKRKATARKSTKRTVARRAKSRRNAPRGVVMSERVLKLYYVHVNDGKRYVHEFKNGVSMYALGDNVIMLRRPDGLSLAQWFD